MGRGGCLLPGEQYRNLETVGSPHVADRIYEALELPIPAAIALATPTRTTMPVPEPTDYATVEELVRHPSYDPEWGEPKYGGIIAVRTSTSQRAFCPWCNILFSNLYVRPQYNTLLRHDPWEGQDAIYPDLANAWEISGDGLTYTFALRQGVYFRDPIPQDEANGLGDMPGRGTELTCEDAKASIDFWGTPEWAQERSLSSLPDMLDSVSGTSCPDGPDGYTLVVNLAFPWVPILEAMAHSGLTMVDKEWLEWLLAEHPKEIRDGNWSLNMGTGPFVGTEYDFDILTKLRRNGNYWREALPFVDGMDVFVIVDRQR